MGPPLDGGGDPPEQTLYAMATFTELQQSKIYMIGSDDLVTWYPWMGEVGEVYDNAPLVSRDPDIYDDGTYYWMAITNKTEAYSSWGLLRSTDLIHWTKSDVDCSGIANVNQVWGPGWFKDSDNSVHIIFCANTTLDANMHMYEMHPTNAAMTEWSTPVKITGTGLRTNQIDGFVLKIDSTYYMLVKDDDTKWMEMMSSASLTSGWSMLKTGDWAGWGNDVEACHFKKVGSRWWAFMDVGAGLSYSYSDDDWDTWTAPALIDTPDTAAVYANGMVIEPR